MEKKLLINKIKYYSSLSKYLIEEHVEKFEKGEDLYFENKDFILSLNKNDNDLIKNENNYVSYYYKTLDKDDNSFSYSIISSDEDYVYDIFLNSISFLDSKVNYFTVLAYDKKDIKKNNFNNFRVIKVYKSNFHKSEFIHEIKTLFKFFSNDKEIRLKLLLKQNDFIKRLLS